MKFNICGRIVDDNHDPLVISEIGINHGGSLATAFEMVDSAYSAGAEIIKHQTHIVDDEMSSKAKSVIPGNSTKSIYSIMDECSLDEKDEIELKNYVESKGMIFLSTPFSRAAAFRLNKMGVHAYKIGSGECNNFPLIKLIAEFGKPMIISTGMNNIETIKRTETILKKAGVPYSFMHTTNLYPTPPELVRLGAMQEMMNKFPGIEIGLSDHTTSNLACFSAVAMGANILERHFTDSMSRDGPDIVNSMDPKALKELIAGSKEIQKMRGGKKEAAKEEKVTIDFAFATVVSTKKISLGEKLTKENLWVKRPGTGDIKAEDYEKVLGKTATRNIEKDKHLTWEDFD